MKLIQIIGLTLLAIVPALCWPSNGDAERLYAHANAYPGVMFQNIPERQKYVEEQYNPLYYDVNQGSLKQYVIFIVYSYTVQPSITDPPRRGHLCYIQRTLAVLRIEAVRH